MTSVLLLLDDVPPDSLEGRGDDWFFTVAASLVDNSQDWISTVARIGRISDEHAWSLLSWIEKAASHVVRTRSAKALVTSAFAMSLVLQSDLDRRDCAIVASLLRRASALADLDFAALVVEGCEQAGTTGQEALNLLLSASPRIPSTHLESGSGDEFSFVRAEADFDVDDLERWLEGDAW